MSGDFEPTKRVSCPSAQAHSPAGCLRLPCSTLITSARRDVRHPLSDGCIEQKKPDRRVQRVRAGGRPEGGARVHFSGARRQQTGTGVSRGTRALNNGPTGPG